MASRSRKTPCWDFIPNPIKLRTARPRGRAILSAALPCGRLFYPPRRLQRLRRLNWQCSGYRCNRRKRRAFRFRDYNSAGQPDAPTFMPGQALKSRQRIGTGDAPSLSAARVRRPGITPRCAFCLNSGKTNAKNSRRAKSQIRTTPTGKTRPYPTARLSALSLSGAKILIPWGVRPMKHPKKQMPSPGMKWQRCVIC